MMTPNICRLVEAILKIANPINKVLKGVNEFNMEATELSISVSAMANKNAGKNEPNKTGKH